MRMTEPVMSWHSALNWRHALVHPIIPGGEGETTPVSARISLKLLKEIDAIAKETTNSRTDTILHMLRWAVSEYRRQRETEQADAKRR